MHSQTKYGYNVVFLATSRVETFQNISQKCYLKKVTQVSLIKMPLLREGEGSRFILLKAIYHSYFIDNLNLLKKSYKKLWQGDNACHSIKEESSKPMVIERKSPAINRVFSPSSLHQ